MNCLAHTPAALLQQSQAGAHTSASISPSESVCIFGEFQLEANGALTREGKTIHLPPKELAALRFLLLSPGQIVSPEAIKKALWGNVHVTDDSVPRCLSSLRARLEPGACIQTVYKRGYRLSAPVRVLDVAPAPAKPRLAIMPFSATLLAPTGLGVTLAEETQAALATHAPDAATLLAHDQVFSLAARGAASVEVGQALNADLVLTGSLSCIGSLLRLRAAMIRAADGVQLWLEDLSTPIEKAPSLAEMLAQRLLFRFDVDQQHMFTAPSKIHLLR